MKYIYESIQPGLFNFTIPGEDKTVHLFLGSKITLNQKLTGGYLRVLKLIDEVDEVEETIETQVVEIKPKAKIEDKITKVEEIIETPIIENSSSNVSPIESGNDKKTPVKKSNKKLK